MVFRYLILFALTLCSFASCSNPASGGSTPSAPRQFHVLYDSNGAESGDVPVETKTFLPDSTVTVLGNTGNLAKVGSTFVGWNTSGDGAGTNYTPGMTLKMPGTDLTLFAAWSVLPTHRVIYDGNSATTGTAPVDSTGYLAGATATVLGNTGTLAKAGYEFGGWTSKSDGIGSLYVAGQKITIGADDVYLFAKWNSTAGDGQITVTGPDDMILTLTLGSETVAYGTGVTASVTSSETVEPNTYSWYLDAEKVAGQTSSVFSGGTDLVRGPHTLMVSVNKHGVDYSASAGFTVQ